MNSELESLIKKGESLNPGNKQGISDWIFDVESYLKQSQTGTKDTDRWIKNVKKQNR